MNKALDFLKEVRVELQSVVWPTTEQTVKLTVVVLLVTIIVSFFVFLIDSALTKGLELFFTLK
ncbi:preprotein translocase subunit SecE [Candidatus Daviesbacteria bacterium RIFCSPLOWO2_02_FULL_40_8]|uniref:Protein translocase subunit SecE n=1 Tax=Candidatus Daviesbacteria bacterium RIFCSPLOWO2_01_FULL_40_24 TaxID=1797787 RepID=A0A1F5MJH1_9BACT|nr:MAG: preprotein translocase subunit SecE [Candidatus Daviesbacteria bacterium RIFCSPHIGHO2_01_FULL_41_45]OGE35622.1 MAG: preprotein translocase subunit SecE [Candidatus Daviesbacteria bacterium RIFCSPHIGHO2_02_FULL_41_14]OGE65502.1 MAG: preprotein translocase subunit SecE [Candidatus Daviesbacteria bacterium RIFCSPLOWO2_01_FULL_40_24]OGE66984.1 MAG: preprotein translocase subunit SecE [Candidatus Daviesbacteria bacterium RIFCSPLOWO2_02_FULL_40_8]